MYGGVSWRFAAWWLSLPVVALSAIGHAVGLEGSAWLLESLAGRGVAPKPAVTLRFEQGRVQGNDGCNQYGGPYTADGASIRLGGSLMSTQMACPEPVMQQARAFTDALSMARAARIVGERLVLLDASGTELARFTAQAQGLAGTSWRVTGYNNGRQAVVSVDAGATLTLQFSADGSVGGSGGCNRYTGTYTTSSGGLRFGPLGATRRACVEPEGVMEQEAAFLRALGTASRARIDGDRLELRTAAGALAVTALRDVPAAAGVPLAAHGLRLPATFRGVLPCADCEGIRHHLDLWPDQVFHLRREWLGRQVIRDDIGRWSIDPQRAALVLRGGAEMPLQFAIKGPDTLRALDIKGEPIDSKLPYEIRSDGSLQPTDVATHLGGEMTYLADAARFTECLTGRSYPVAMEGDFVAMQRGYAAAVKQPGAPMYVTFEGEILDRPPMEDAGAVRTVVVKRFINAWPGQRCERARADASLANTYWRIVKLGDAAVRPGAGRREPHVLLRSAAGRGGYSATVGCNTLNGAFTADGETIRFAPGAATLMACPAPLDALERRLGEVLAQAVRWRINASTLELYDAKRAPIALLEAVYL
jgi:heat shock protein HslJ